ncbi:MAG: hypothetical protein AAF725_21230 [Acidobacteriota bacterium]
MSVDPSSRPPAAFSRQLGLGVAGLFFLALLASVARWGVDVPYWDQWVLVHHLESLERGTLDVAELWAPHNEHRLLLPKALMLGLASVSGWDIRLELWVHLAFALALFAAALALMRRTAGELPGWLVALSGASIFGLAQWHNWSWGWQSQIFLNVLLVTAGLAVLAGEGRFRVPLAAACGAAATCSFATGLLFWPLAAPLAWRGEPRGRGLRLAAWAAASAAMIGLYLWGLPPSEEMRQTLGPGASLKLFLGYVSVYLGGSLLPFDGRTALFGAPLLALPWLILAAPTLLSRRRFARALPLLLWAAYGVGSAALTALGRLPAGGIGQALSSRYITISQVFWLGLFALAAGLERGDFSPSRLEDGGWRRRLRRFSAAAVALALGIGGAFGALEMRDQARERSEIRRQILAGTVSDASLERLEALGLGLYRGKERPPASATPR